jgi:hypothetical protein
LQVKSQLPCAQVEAPFVTFAHGTHAAPHAEVLESDTHWPLQRWKPALQESVQAPPVEQPLMPLGSVGHGVHRLPHVATSAFETQALPQAWKPLLHAMPHDVPLQVELPLAGTAHGEQAPPHVAVSRLLTHTPLQR